MKSKLLKKLLLVTLASTIFTGSAYALTLSAETSKEASAPSLLPETDKDVYIQRKSLQQSSQTWATQKPQQYILTTNSTTDSHKWVEENSTSYFGITPNFVKAMDGKFENTIVIMMGAMD